ncbi:YjeF domain-containing protein [Cantharellus anzutake]|uniref:YjeF domain-containing protein n=1 Tax=Cantharellus anzutake TaxID=1750568 RepID=UPI001906FA71|nr:YjeF domain-containing protein [Cantharellus anzutake]KAF8328388.1 YjeF domain-containing protein [Cantharellus anzutake]
MAKRILNDVRRIIPPLSPKMHKGQAGRVGVVGGSQDYTGAPFFAAIDLSHVICSPDAGSVIKTYSPDLIVHPIFNTKDDRARVESQLRDIFERLHVVVIGPGLGREDHMQDYARMAISIARDQDKYVVLDADGLWLIQKHPEYIRGYRKAVLTPNIVEFGRLRDALKIPKDAPADTLVSRIAKELGDVVILQKGAQDIISNGKRTEIIDVEGGLKRCGGQGDILSGAVGTFLAWGKAYAETTIEKGDSEDSSIDIKDVPLLAACGASTITRVTSKLAFKKLGRGVVTGDMISEIGRAYEEVFGDVGEKGWKGKEVKL